ncbi:MAG: MlaE family lipid ABC transporter permease subunit [Methylobacteriaceae bacterium]|nr:MlaE family lipid ABC transporter permease subunit [Methylobacteriaceae bacterium]
MVARPTFTSERTASGLNLVLSGTWTSATGHDAEEQTRKLLAEANGAEAATLDLAGIERLDTAGAWLIDRTREALGQKGIAAEFAGARREFATLLHEAHYRAFDVAPREQGHWLIDHLTDIGRGVVMSGRDVLNGTSFLGEVVAKTAWLFVDPRQWRPAAVVHQLENFALRSVPIITLINFLVGCIVAQQGIFQLRRFGASTFAVDLIGILVLRELGVLLTSIMIAGRTGSAITAELGSMKMREEIDALRVMGLDPIAVLVVPRILALIIALPLLTFLAAMSAIFGGLLVAWGYAGITPEIYLARLQAAISLHTFYVGLIKAPFMAIVIGLIATIEGFGVEGSAESLGRQVTASVVKSIFMVIVVDGLFAMFFASIDY